MEVSSENDREGALPRLKESFSIYYVVEGTKMLLPKLTVVGIPSDKQGDKVISAICEKMNSSNNWLNQVKR